MNRRFVAGVGDGMLLRCLGSGIRRFAAISLALALIDSAPSRGLESSVIPTVPELALPAVINEILTRSEVDEARESVSLIGLASGVEVDPQLGNARGSIVIEVPPGYSGLTPDLTVRDSSLGTAAAFGYGWDMALGVVTRSRRDGVPLDS